MTSREILLANAGTSQGVYGGFVQSGTEFRDFLGKSLPGLCKGRPQRCRGQTPDKEKPAMGSAGLKVFTRSWDYPMRPTVKGM